MNSIQAREQPGVQPICEGNRHLDALTLAPQPTSVEVGQVKVVVALSLLKARARIWYWAHQRRESVAGQGNVEVVDHGSPATVRERAGFAATGVEVGGESIGVHEHSSAHADHDIRRKVASASAAVKVSRGRNDLVRQVRYFGGRK
jgi:hypothetical protein